MAYLRCGVKRRRKIGYGRNEGRLVKPEWRRDEESKRERER